jgi:hypothetical protein
MKRFIVFILFVLATAEAFAQSNSDSLAYQLQRAKINAMLAQRAQQFGQYDQSLTMHTGIFGLQTKKDIRRSNDILMDIVKKDDDIYKQIKILLDFRTFQQKQVQTHYKAVEDNTIGYMTAINKLRNEVDHLKADAARQQKGKEQSTRKFVIALAVMTLLVLVLLTRRRTVKA